MNRYLKSYYKIAVLVFMTAFLFSCNHSSPDKNNKAARQKIEVRFIGEIITRRTFADIQFMESKEEQDKYIARQEKANPVILNNFTKLDSFLIKNFERIGLIRNNEFLLDKFLPQTKSEAEYIDGSGRVLNLIFYSNSLTGHTHFKLALLKDTVDVDTQATTLQDLDYAFLDIIPGGNKELVFLDDCYIMNGYNFTFKVYEIKFG